MDLNAWESCEYLRGMLEFIQPRTTDRKMRLFACACCRRFWNQYPDDRCRSFITSIERYADGLENDTSVQLAFFDAEEAANGTSNALADALLSLYSVCGVHEYQDRIRGVLAERVATLVASESDVGIKVERQAQVQLLRDIVGPLPFIDSNTINMPSSSEIQEIALYIYQSGDFERYSQLSNAFQSFGCDDSYVMSHCHNKQKHSKGCWVIDMILQRC